MCEYQLWFDALDLKHAERMVKILYASLKDWELSEDVVHATFTTLLSKGEVMMKHEDIDGWLYKAMRYHAGNELQRSYRKVEELFDPQETEFGWRDTYFSLEEEFPSGLKDGEKDILRMYFIEGLDYEETAACLDKSEPACRTRLCRARANFKELWLKEKNSENSCNKTQGSTNKKDRRPANSQDVK